MFPDNDTIFRTNGPIIRKEWASAPPKFLGVAWEGSGRGVGEAQARYPFICCKLKFCMKTKKDCLNQ